MKIGVDVRVLEEGRQSGVEQYTENLLRELFQLDQVNEYVLFFNAFRGSGISRVKKIVGDSRNVTVKTLRLPNKILNSSFVLLNLPKIDTLIGGCDVFFSPNIRFGSVSKKVKHVVTFHDLSFELYPEFLSLKRRWWHKVVSPKRIAKNASRIITVSESTKRDLMRQYKTDAAKIATVHSGAPRLHEAASGTLEEYKIAGDYILFFATLEPRKNTMAVLQAYEMFRKMSAQKVSLVFAGASGWLEKEVKSRWKNSSYAADIIFTGPVSEEQKTALYQGAKVLLYISIYEGFGFPPLEAMQLGTPVITSHVSSLPEVVGNAAIMVDPLNAQDIASALTQVMQSSELRETLRVRGFAQVKKFSWRKTAQETLAILQS